MCATMPYQIRVKFVRIRQVPVKESKVAILRDERRARTAATLKFPSHDIIFEMWTCSFLVDVSIYNRPSQM